jgi:hypothetical protein
MTPTPAEPSIDLEPYMTSDTPYAAFLHYSGHKIVGSKQDPNDYKREVMVFVFTDEIPELEEHWRAGKATGDLKKFHRSLKIVTRFVNEQRNKRNF